MSYIFKNIERKVYPNTFLKDVHIRMNFEGNLQTGSGLEDFFQSNFNLSILDKLPFHGIVVNSQDGLIGFDFSLEHLILTLRYPAYKQFEFALQWLDLIKKYLELLNIVDINHLSISKYNELGYTLPKGVDVESVMREVFSKEMLKFAEEENGSLTSEKDGFSSTSRWEKFGSFDGADVWNSAFNFEFGFYRQVTTPLSGKLTLKTSIESKDVLIKRDDIKSVLSAFNDVLDRGFHWCVSDSIIKKMEEK